MFEKVHLACDDAVLDLTMTTKRIVITGGLGFIGSHLVDHYVERGIPVSIIDAATEDSSELVKTMSPLVDLFQVDLGNMSEEDEKVVSSQFEVAGIVYHLASALGVRKIDKNPKQSILNNYKMDSSIFRLLSKHKAKVVYASTSEVYGENTNAQESTELKIGSPEVLRWGYACNKLMSEFVLKSSNFPFAIARIFNTSGPRQKASVGMVIPRFIEQAVKNESLTVYDDGRQLRSFCHINDTINMLVILGENDECNGEIFNVGTARNNTSILELAQLVIQRTGSKSDIKFLPYHQELSKQSADIKERIPCVDKMERLYTCKFTLNDIVDSIVSSANE